MGNDQQFSLRWNNYLHHITGAFYSLRSDLDLVDVTLSCEGKKIKAHKMLLSACSSYFRELFKDNPCKHPVIIFRDVKYNDLEALIDFMYQGEVNVVQEQLNSFLNTAELLEVQGLTEGSNLGGTDDLVNEVVQPKEHRAKQQPLTHTEPVTKPPKKPGVVPSSPKIPAVSFIPVTKRPETPPVKKRKYSVPRGLNANIIEKDIKPPPQETDSPDPIEVIPMIRSVKIENPEYFEQDSSYDDQVEPSETNMDTLEQVLASSTNNKQEAIEIYSSNSGDSTQHGLAEGLLDLNQVLGTPGTSGEPSQDGLQEKPAEGVDSPNEVPVGQAVEAANTPENKAVEGFSTSESKAVEKVKNVESKIAEGVNSHESKIVKRNNTTGTKCKAVQGDTISEVVTPCGDVPVAAAEEEYAEGKEINKEGVEIANKAENKPKIVKEVTVEWFGCKICFENKAKPAKFIDGKRCPVCDALHPCDHLLKSHMHFIHGWFSTLRQF